MPGLQDNSTPINLAAQHGHLEVIMALLGAGADVNAFDEVGLSPSQRWMQVVLHSRSVRLHIDSE
jgi:ankyrin repeat protein